MALFANERCLLGAHTVTVHVGALTTSGEGIASIAMCGHVVVGPFPKINSSSSASSLVSVTAISMCHVLIQRMR